VLYYIKHINSYPELIDENLAAMDALSSENIIREGGLKKRGRNSFKDKYFMLDRRCIYYGASKRSIF